MVPMVMQQRQFRPGDCVIYVLAKSSVHPGPRARNIRPARLGDTYRYVVDKCWVVAEILPSGQLILRTRRGKTHTVSPDDPRLKRPTWWQQVRYRHRFNAVKEGVSPTRVLAGS